MPTETLEANVGAVLARGEVVSSTSADDARSGTQPKSKNETRILNAEEPTWYKDAIIYQVHVKSFFDSNNDGIGDFKGLIEKLDYIAALGVNTIWLLPFYPSPLRDDGYDIADYYGVHPDYGTIDDLRQLIAQAHAKGLRVITELVINHTSDQHRWFQQARKAPAGSAERDYYVWSDTEDKYTGTRIIFLDTEKSNWTWDPEAKAYFWHRFYSHQPDLNFDNPAVLEAVLKVMNYWLDMGVDGLRLDAVPYLVEREGTNNENLPETHEILKRIRAEVDATHPGCLLLAEANQWPEDTQEYFGAGDECHMAFHFPLMPRMYMALAQEDRFPITDILRQTPTIPDNCQWAIFLRNHDELTLEMVTDKERDYLWNQYAAESRARINLGIRRRLAPLMQRDRRRVELLNSLLLTMPGTPVIYYGDEIGMGDNIYLGDRDGVRTPMQWSPDRNGGFSKADPSRLMLPPIMDPLYGFSAINVEAQSRDPYSMLNWTRSMLEVRKKYQAFGRGTFKMLYPANRRVLAYIREFPHAEDGKAETILCLANVSRAAQAVELDLSAYAGYVPLELSGGSLFPPVGELNYLLTLPPFGFNWFLLANETHYPDWYAPPPEPLPDYLTLVLRKDVSDVTRLPLKSTLEQEILPAYLNKRRWFSGKGNSLGKVSLVHSELLPRSKRTAHETDQIILTEFSVDVGDETQHYQIPLTVFDEDHQSNALAHQLALARVRRTHQVGTLTDGVSSDAFACIMLELLQLSSAQAQPVTSRVYDANFEGNIYFTATRALAEAELDNDELEIRTLCGEQSNTSIILGERAVLKVLRRLFSGPHPEATMSGALTERGFANTAPLLGHVYRKDDQGETVTLAVLQGYIPNQGNGWEWALEHLARLHLEIAELCTNELAGAEFETDIRSLQDAETREFERFTGAIGTRLGEMHRVLCAPTTSEEFKPEVVDEAMIASWIAAAQSQVRMACNHLNRATATLETHLDRELARAIIEVSDAIEARIEALAQYGKGTMVFRIHGDLHLGQILVSQDDAYFIDFEGEPTRTVSERTEKASPYRDLAGVLRSFQYVVDTAANNAASNQRANDIFGGLLRDIRATCERTFLESYKSAAGDLAPKGQQAQAHLNVLRLFTLEKAAYEICYEAANRPDWLKTPLHGFAGLLQELGLLPEEFSAARFETSESGRSPGG